MALLSHSRAWNCSAETARAARQSSGERGHSNTNRTRTHAFYPSLYALHRPCPELVGALRAERERPFTLNGLLFDDLVSAGEDRRRDGEAERLGGLEIDDQLEGRWLLDRQIGRLGALQGSVRRKCRPGDGRLRRLSLLKRATDDACRGYNQVASPQVRKFNLRYVSR